MNDYSLVKLFPSSGEEIIRHFIEMSEDDRYLRFGYKISDVNLAKYIVTSFETGNNTWYGIKINNCLVATIHIAISHDVAEFAFTTAEGHRGKKLGQLLFARGYQMIVEHQITRIYLACLSKNEAIKNIARKFGLSVMTFGSDAEAEVVIKYPVPLSKINEVKMCMIDKALFK
jgi:RimJ/RimL family protein N-acetyltransferase